MNFYVLTLFPDQISGFLNTSIIGRALEKEIISLNTVQIRDFSPDKHRKVDDTLYGGGFGMLMTCEPVYRAWQSIVKEKDKKSFHTVYLSPRGRVFDQKKAIELSSRENLVLLCGHYEGIDQRVLDEIVDEEISIGDYVLTGGEIAACTVIDSVARLIDHVLPDSSAYEEESHMSGVLEAPQYTKPAIWHGREVPEILLGGHHDLIRKWKRHQSLYETMRKRPDMFSRCECTEEEWKTLIVWMEEEKEDKG